MFFRVQLSVVRRDVDICGQFQDDLEHRELRLENQLGAVREFGVDQRGRQQGDQRSPVLSQFLTAAEAAGHPGAIGRADSNDRPSDEEEEYEEVERDGNDDDDDDEAEEDGESEDA